MLDPQFQTLYQSWHGVSGSGDSSTAGRTGVICDRFWNGVWHPLFRWYRSTPWYSVMTKRTAR